MSGKTETRVIYRRSDTGRLTTQEYAKGHPNTTEREKVRVPAPKPQQPKGK